MSRALAHVRKKGESKQLAVHMENTLESKNENVKVWKNECMKVWKSEIFGGARGEHLRLPEQVVAVAANVEKSTMGGRVVQTSTGDVQRVGNLGDLLETDSSSD